MNASIESLPVRRLFGINMHAATMMQVVAVCRRAIDSRRPLRIGVVNAAKIVNMQRQPLLHESVSGSDIVLADGMAVVWASRILGRPLPERVAGIDLFEQLLELADERGFSVYLLGATQDVMSKLVGQIRERYPGLKIAGARDGYFSEEEAEQVATEIRLARPDMLFLGMTSPKKELFMRKWGEYIDASVCHGVGGSFDVLAGKVRRAPRIWQRLGLEWLFRVFQEPGRMWKRYLVTNSLFIGLLLKQCIHPEDSQS